MELHIEKTTNLVLEIAQSSFESWKHQVQTMDSPKRETLVIHNVLGKHLFVKFNTRELTIMEMIFLGGDTLGNITIKAPF
tara:strand:+ start:333 stop:572 length:240 start_codon:yes stop_codon:yes gene_type:complete